MADSGVVGRRFGAFEGEVGEECVEVVSPWFG